VLSTDTTVSGSADADDTIPTGLPNTGAGGMAQ
jgi:hypothetical protein